MKELHHLQLKDFLRWILVLIRFTVHLRGYLSADLKRFSTFLNLRVLVVKLPGPNGSTQVITI